jgi:2-polyprenyl-3-methyl-5-hydroxy-6-metoxy-1,4-benzoquinol methylase
VTLEGLRRTWETLGREDPLWAILSHPSKRNNRWDTEEFFRTGQDEIEKLLLNLDRRGLGLKMGRCLDFGCGVGRVSQALCTHFASVDGVDIAQTMLDEARKYNQHGERCRFHLNTSDNLSIFSDGTFDFVYSNIVLQHMESDLAERYIAEFMRVLVPAGLAVFQVPSEFHDPDRLTSHEAQIDADASQTLDTSARMQVNVRVRNLGSDVWRASAPIRIGNHWLDRDGSMLVLDDGRAALPHDMHPGDETSVVLPVTTPGTPGQYVLEVDLVEEGVAWFGTRESTTVRREVKVVKPPAWKRVSRTLRENLQRYRTRRDTNVALVSEMHTLRKERVLATATAAGGEVVGVEDMYAPGPGWVSYTYFVRRT